MSAHPAYARMGRRDICGNPVDPEPMTPAVPVADAARKAPGYDYWHGFITCDGETLCQVYGDSQDAVEARVALVMSALWPVHGPRTEHADNRIGAEYADGDISTPASAVGTKRSEVHKNPPAQSVETENNQTLENGK